MYYFLLAALARGESWKLEVHFRFRNILR